MFYDLSPFFVTGWRGKSEKNQKRQSKLGRKMPYRKCLIASQGPFLTAAENYIIIIIWVPPSLSTKECIALPRPGSWDLGTPRMVNILTSATPTLMGERPRAHYRFLDSKLSRGPGGPSHGFCKMLLNFLEFCKKCLQSDFFAFLIVPHLLLVQLGEG